ncbi:MAG: tryptophan synthase subunit alpha [Muribaculaceae bacterium]|nr:tryptophan synthase subunit alpha [Roseburia sp.]MCM1430331.1 tryptophan synthase subunit alpha [Muribaculaceae bacterium]MCM1492473.1 tryptophan synthase subunit alpha [Muribaculaceae bacterium]
MNRIEQSLAVLQEKKEKAFITYMTAGLPDYSKTKALIRAQERAGTDIIELGIPFSDPVADGPVIQAASYDAIQAGASLSKTFVCMKELRKEGVNIPIIFMMYYNTVLHYGLEAFVRQCGVCGVDGLIIPDLPFEEQEELTHALGGPDATILIPLVSPVSKKRVPMLLENARGFVYCVSSMGVTGQENGFHREVVNYLSYVKSVSNIPVMMGFGIKNAADVAPVAENIDGAIVGSHFIRLLRESDFSEEAAEKYCSAFKRELNAL